MQIKFCIKSDFFMYEIIHSALWLAIRRQLLKGFDLWFSRRR